MINNDASEDTPAEITETPLATAPTPVPAPKPVWGAYDFGDYKSTTLATNAWHALVKNDTKEIEAYTDKCIEMYSEEAARMQASLNDFPSGEENILSYAALNDVATCLFVKGEAHYKAKDTEKAKAAYQRIIDEFSYGQTYDPASRTFWKPVEGAKDGLYMIEKGLFLDFGDMSSLAIVRRMWKSLGTNNIDEMIMYGRKLERLYGQTAKDMMLLLKDFPPLPAENIHLYWALNDVGTGIFILGEAFNALRMKDDAIAAYRRVTSDYYFSQCWNEAGWFWKPAFESQQKILELEAR